jgi:AbrB family looped-hinge helix DNA binding protein
MTKITAKGQTAIPRQIRAALKAKPGDLLAWEVSAGGRVEVRRARSVDAEYLQMLADTLSEWADPEDEKVYRDL